jgi:prephenate dehydratase
MKGSTIACSGPIGDVAIEILKPYGEIVVAEDGSEESLLKILEGAVGLVLRGDGSGSARVIETATDLKVIGEIKVDVNHCLLATEETDYREIRVVYSHPQALAQCRDFLIRNKLEPRPYYDTAGAAKMLARENHKAAAAIASALCAELYNLQIIKEGIEDGPSNSTRFLLLSKSPYADRGDKTSIVFAVAHEAGELFGVLKLFAEANINLTRISSMPLRSDPSNYSFFLDFEGSQGDAKVDEVLEQMKKMTISLKNLGSYPAAKGGL